MGVKTEAKNAVRRWVERNEKRRLPILSIRHVHARAKVEGYAAALCLIVRCDWRDAEKHMREDERQYPLTVLRCFDPKLREGDPCWVAYVSTPNIGEFVAVRVRRAVAAKPSKAKRAKATAASEAQK